MTLTKISFNTLREANAFITAVMWINDSGISLEKAVRCCSGKIELTLKDTDSQNDTIPHLDLESIITIIEKEGSPSRGKVYAECWSDDHRVEAKFDASAYFAQASIKEILDLEQSDWSMDYASDAVAEFFEDLNPDVGAMFTYKRTATMGFGCTVDRNSAIDWLQHNRTELFENGSPLKALIEDSRE